MTSTNVHDVWDKITNISKLYWNLQKILDAFTSFVLNDKTIQWQNLFRLAHPDPSFGRTYYNPPMRLSSLSRLFDKLLNKSSRTPLSVVSPLCSAEVHHVVIWSRPSLAVIMSGEKRWWMPGKSATRDLVIVGLLVMASGKHGTRLFLFEFT